MGAINGILMGVYAVVIADPTLVDLKSNFFLLCTVESSFIKLFIVDGA